MLCECRLVHFSHLILLMRSGENQLKRYLYRRSFTYDKVAENKCSKSTYTVRMQHSMYCLSIEAQILAPSRVMKIPRLNRVLSRLCFGHSKALTSNIIRTVTNCSTHIDTEKASIQPVPLPHTYTTDSVSSVA